MNSVEAREYVRLATTETKGRTKTACDLLIAESVKLSKIEQIIEKWNEVNQYEYENALIDIQKVLEQE